MNDAAHNTSRAKGLVRAIALTAVLALGTAGCSSGDSSDNGAKATSTAPDAKKAAVELKAGLKAHAAGDLTTAAAKYKETLKYDPENKFAFYNLALIDSAAGNYGLAEAKYRAALKADPTYEPALFNLAILRTGPDPEEATQLYRDAVKSNRKDASAWLNLGLLLRASGKKLDGDKAVLRAVALNPDLVDPEAGTQ